MNDWLKRYRDCEVEILYLTDNNAYKDRGRLADMDAGWVELEKSGGEIFLVPCTSIRILKILSPPDKAENLLLRPAGKPEIGAEKDEVKGKNR
jgi:hypothetical protein